jgi:hypothetical protein
VTDTGTGTFCDEFFEALDRHLAQLPCVLLCRGRKLLERVEDLTALQARGGEGFLHCLARVLAL